MGFTLAVMLSSAGRSRVCGISFKTIAQENQRAIDRYQASARIASMVCPRHRLGAVEFRPLVVTVPSSTLVKWDALKWAASRHLIWIWSHSAPERLAAPVAAALGESGAEIWVSPIGVWEFLLLVERKRLTLEIEPGDWLDAAWSSAGLREAPLNREVARRSRTVRLPHQDSADRFLLRRRRSSTSPSSPMISACSKAGGSRNSPTGRSAHPEIGPVTDLTFARLKPIRDNVRGKACQRRSDDRPGIHAPAPPVPSKCRP